MATARSRSLDPCLVCGAKAIGYNFGVLTCMACKAFFRRNAVKLGKYEFICPKDGDCPITHDYRRLCNCCRLAKCFRVGMQKSLILTEAEKEARRHVVAQNRLKKVSRSLTTIQSLIPPMVKSDLRSSLTTTDHEILSNIFNTYSSICLEKKNSTDLSLPRIVHSSIYEFFQDYFDIHQSLLKFIMRVPQVHQLVNNQQLLLSKSQISIINHINVTMLHPNMSNNLLLSLQTLFGSHLASRMLQCVERVQQLSYDPILLKLMLLIITLSNGIRQSDAFPKVRLEDEPSTIEILRVQNTFVELLWKYISYRSSTEMHTIKLWLKLVQFLLFIQDVHLTVEEFVENRPSESRQIEPLIENVWPTEQ